MRGDRPVPLDGGGGDCVPLEQHPKKEERNPISRLICVSCKRLETGVYEIGCLCVIPEFQGKGFGANAIQYVKTLHKDREKLTLVTPIDKKENVRFLSKNAGSI